MSSVSRENPTENNDSATIKQHLDTVAAVGGGRDSCDSDNGIVDNNISISQSEHSSSVGGTNEHDQSDESDESDVELILLNGNGKKRLFYRNMILYFGREFVVFLILLLTTYATYQNMPPKVSKISPGQPFFPKGSQVKDWPDGQLTVKSKLLLTDLSFVLFYAPWCAESQHARVSYEYVARLFATEAEFSAINCWQPGGECRAHYTKVMTWPVLMAYMQNGLAVPYNGRWNSRELTQFVRALMNPMKRFSNPDELLTEMASHDAVVVAFVDLLVHRSYFTNFYKTAVKWIEKDPNQEVVFGVVTGETMKQFGIEATPVVRMYLWNDTIEYQNSTWTQPELSKFVATNIHQVSAWVSPPGSKSTTLASFLKRGPAVVLFTPRIHYSPSNDAYTLLRQTALQYYNCPSSNEVWIREMSREYTTEQRLKSQEEHNKFQETCKNLFKTDRLSQRCAQSTVSVTFANVVNSSNDKLPGQRIFGPLNANEQSIGFSYRYNKYNVDSCDAVPTFHYGGATADDSDSESSGSRTKFPVSMLNSNNDHRSSESLTRRDLRLKCEMFVHGDEENINFFVNNDKEEDFDSIAGLSCKSNQTLSFLAMDSLLYHTFAERMGVNVLKSHRKTVLLIVDYENESTFVLKEPLSTRNAIDFIANFHNKTLTRHLKSTSRKRVKSSTDTKRYIPIRKTFALREINSDNFVDQVVLSNKTVAVLFYSAQCALCSLMSHTLMMASKMLQDIDRIDFVRIDGDRNDLPWQYTIDKYPALLVFPENRKMESRIFSTNLQVNIQNVLGFVLANINRPIRLHALVLICQNVHKTSPHDDCFRVLRIEITDSISHSLTQWRKIPHHRGQIYRRLQILQRMYLQLFRIGVSCDFSELIVCASDIRRVWTMM